MAFSAAGTICSGRVMRSQYFETACSVSFTVTSPRDGTSSCCSTGSEARDANTSPGRSSTGSRFTVASAAPVTRFVAPGPMDVVQAKVDRRSFIRA